MMAQNHETNYNHTKKRRRVSRLKHQWDFMLGSDITCHFTTCMQKQTQLEDHDLDKADFYNML